MHNTVKCKICGEILAQGESFPNMEVVCEKCNPYQERKIKPMTISIDYDELTKLRTENEELKRELMKLEAYGE